LLLELKNVKRERKLAHSCIVP